MRVFVVGYNWYLSVESWPSSNWSSFSGVCGSRITGRDSRFCKLRTLWGVLMSDWGGREFVGYLTAFVRINRLAVPAVSGVKLSAQPESENNARTS